MLASCVSETLRYIAGLIHAGRVEGGYSWKLQGADEESGNGMVSLPACSRLAPLK